MPSPNLSQRERDRFVVSSGRRALISKRKLPLSLEGEVIYIKKQGV